MDLLFKIRDFIKHLDVHLNALAGNNLALFYGAIFLVVFCETGLVVTPFLPGDSLLFALGSIAGADAATLSLPLMIVLLVVAAVLGDAVNYAIGYRLGPKVFKYESSWFFNKKHLLRAQTFYEKYGNKTIILCHSCRSCGHLHRLSPALARCAIRSSCCITSSVPSHGC